MVQYLAYKHQSSHHLMSVIAHTSRRFLQFLLLLLGLSLALSPAMAKRAIPKPLAPAVEAGLIYSVPHDNERKGIVRATDDASGKLLWETAVFEVKIDPNLEEDVQMVFITSLKLDKGPLKAADEKGRKCLIDPKTGKVTQDKN